MFDYSNIKKHPYAGTYIALDGLGGAGKGEQVKELVSYVQDQGYRVHQRKMPNYDTSTGQAINRYTGNEFGDASKIDPHIAAMMYVLNRTTFNKELPDLLATKNDVLICDRGPLTNYAYQGAKLAESDRKDFFEWLSDVEFGEFGSHREDLYIVLYANEESYRKLAEKRVAESGDKSAGLDGHETPESIKKIHSLYLQLADFLPWAKTINCFDDEDNLMPISSVHKLVRAVVDPLLPN